jgi:hypothetical protein
MAWGREHGAGSKGQGEKGGKCLRHIDCDFQPTNSTFAKMSRMTEKDYKPYIEWYSQSDYDYETA